jgi:hypothetical protein
LVVDHLPYHLIVLHVVGGSCVCSEANDDVAEVLDCGYVFRG